MPRANFITWGPRKGVSHEGTKAPSRGLLIFNAVGWIALSVGALGLFLLGKSPSMILLIGSPIVAALHTGRLINFTQEKARRQREEERLREVQEENARTRARIEQKKRDKPE